MKKRKNENFQLQCRILDILKWFDGFCKDNNLTYYIIGGTLIGAVRHKGFIPWDDDIDVGMPRKDYELFLELTKNKIFDHFKVEENCGVKDKFYTIFSKVYDVNTTLIEKNQNSIKRGIYIDVFPLDGAGNSKKEYTSHFIEISKPLSILYTRHFSVRKGRKWYKNLGIIIAKMLPNFLFNEAKQMEKVNKLLKKIDYFESAFVGNLVGNYGIREIVPIEWFGTPTAYQFEDIMVYGPQDYDKYLTNIYGDYMRLPPEEKRKSLHTYYELNLNKSYLE